MTAKRQPQYEARLGEAAIECMALGLTAAAFAAQIGVSGATLRVWAKAHPEFADALKVGQAKAVAFWERVLAEIARSGKGNATAAIFALKNCAAPVESDSDADTSEPEIPAWSDLEIARRIAHILERANKTESKGKANDTAIP